jgi:hypothetical protein
MISAHPEPLIGSIGEAPARLLDDEDVNTLIAQAEDEQGDEDEDENGDEDEDLGDEDD